MPHDAKFWISCQRLIHLSLYRLRPKQTGPPFNPREVRIILRVPLSITKTFFRRKKKHSYLNKPLLELIYLLNLGKNPSEPSHDCREQEQPEHLENFREVATRQISNLTWYLSDSAFRHEPNCHLYHSDPKFRIPFRKNGERQFLHSIYYIPIYLLDTIQDFFIA